ncbi:MAG: hypothetical protein M3Z03_07125, partial [Actinomycetota bacterium]|nr:hypothetical protein [Actinomycetota bacterium]
MALLAAGLLTLAACGSSRDAAEFEALYAGSEGVAAPQGGGARGSGDDVVALEPGAVVDGPTSSGAAPPGSSGTGAGSSPVGG